MNALWGVSLVLLVIAALVWLLVDRLKKHIPDQTRIADWAKKNGVVVVAERRRFWKGPFFSLGGLVVYRIRVRDGKGQEKERWLCIENFLHGYDTEVKWS